MPKARLECGHIRDIGVARVQRRYYCPKCRARKATVEVVRENV